MTADAAPTAEGDGSRLMARFQLPLWARAGSPAWLWIGVAVSSAGFGLIALAWARTSLETQVYLQVPYLVSAGLVGLAFVNVGLIILNIATRDRDGADRDRQVEALTDVIDEMREALTERGKGRR